MSPFGRVVLVGYHRPLFISGSRVQVLLNGLYVQALGSPTKLFMCPPATKSCPLARKAKPEQKMFAPACVAGVFVFVDGFQRVGLSPRLNAGHHNTLPVGSRCAWTAWYGQVITDENCPTVAGS